jgi:hypothetical protein
MRISCIAVALFLSFAGVLGGCGSGGGGSGGGGAGSEIGSGDCTSECQAAQAADCTSIQGDCGHFCAAADAVGSEAGCPSAYDDYASCLASGSICTGDQRCGTEKSTFTSCAEAYCAAHSGEGNCVTLVSSF